MKFALSVACVLIMALTAGCANDAPTEPVAIYSGPEVDGTKYLLAEEPEGAADVRAARESAKNDEEVLVVGRIGGSHNPWIAGRAAFSIVDRSLIACNDREGDNCPFPWDYCCESAKLPTSVALVKFVDDSGKVVSADARELLSVKELQTVVVRGKAQRDDAGNLTVLATGLFIRK